MNRHHGEAVGFCQPSTQSEPMLELQIPRGVEKELH